MNKKRQQPQPITSAVQYSRVTTNRQDGDLSVAARPMPTFHLLHASRNSWHQRRGGS